MIPASAWLPPPPPELDRLLRHALEQSMLSSLVEDPTSLPVALAVGVLAARCAGLLVTADAKVSDLDDIFRWASAPELHWDALPDAMATRLLALQGRPPCVDAPWTEVSAIVQRALPFAAPVELLFTMGGDSRLRVDPTTGLNHYGCSPRPRPWAITFASCTATSVSPHAYAEAEALRRRLLLAAIVDDPASCTREVDAVKRDIAAAYGLSGTHQVILASSGTDAELFALHLALPSPADSLLNVVVGPGETGSNVGVAAAGRHFDNTTALGASVCKGALLQGLTPGRVEVATVHIRASDGTPLDREAIDRATVAVVTDGVASGRRVLLHVLDTSKTGLVAPGLDTVFELRARYPEAVDVVVDACQLRLCPEALRAYHRRGCVVMITGSKFFTGPPFSGALLLPPEVAHRAAHVPVLAGLGAYASRGDWPVLAAGVPGDLAPGVNLGLLLRWRAALWEMAAFHACEPALVRRIITRFGDAIRGAIEGRPWLHAREGGAIDRASLACGLSADDRWDELPTIFPFTITRTLVEGSTRLATQIELRALYEWLNQDVSSHLRDSASADARTVAARCCHIGQPVVLGNGPDAPAALRVCAGARLVSGVAWDPALGPDPDARLDAEIRDALRIFDKLDVLLEHFDHIARLRS